LINLDDKSILNECVDKSNRNMAESIQYKHQIIWIREGRKSIK